MSRSFNGTSDFIAANTAHVTNGGVAFTIACWVNASLAAANLKNLYGEGNTGAAGPFFQIQGESVSGRLFISARSASTGGSNSLTGTSRPAFDSTWHHIAVTQTTGNVITAYVDGIADGTLTRTALSNSTTQVFNTTSWGTIVRNTNTTFLGGLIAHAALWTRTLSAQEIVSLAAGALPSLFAPVHYWPFWGTDSPEPDIGNHAGVAGVNGTLTGTTAAGGSPTQMRLLRLRGARSSPVSGPGPLG